MRPGTFLPDVENLAVCLHIRDPAGLSMNCSLPCTQIGQSGCVSHCGYYINPNHSLVANDRAIQLNSSRVLP